MTNFKKTQTEKNILTAFAGESQARNRYTYFASKAKREGFHQVAAIFEETANHEKEHAERLFKFLEGGDVEITGTFPAGIIGTTLENLKSAITGENYEHTNMYPDFAKTSREEGFEELAKVLESIAIAETFHEERFKKLADMIENGSIFRKEKPITWVCRNCGYLHTGQEPPEKCPACDHDRGYYQEKILV